MGSRFRTTVLGLVFLAARADRPAPGQCELIELVDPLPAYVAGFGKDGAMAGDIVVVGKWSLNVPPGLAVYRHLDGAWELEANLVPDVRSNADFWVSHKIATDGERIIYGRNREMPTTEQPIQSGAARIYAQSPEGWYEEARIFDPDGVQLDDFGWSVGISGTWAIVGAPEAGGSSGAAYIFKRTALGWTRVRKILPPSPPLERTFATAVAVSHDRVFIGAGYADTKEVQSGRAFVLEAAGILGDLDCDDDIDMADLLTLLRAWGPCEGDTCGADLNDSGQVDEIDLHILASSWYQAPR